MNIDKVKENEDCTPKRSTVLSTYGLFHGGDRVKEVRELTNV